MCCIGSGSPSLIALRFLQRDSISLIPFGFQEVLAFQQRGLKVDAVILHFQFREYDWCIEPSSIWMVWRCSVGGTRYARSTPDDDPFRSTCQAQTKGVFQTLRLTHCPLRILPSELPALLRVRSTRIQAESSSFSNTHWVNNVRLADSILNCSGSSLSISHWTSIITEASL